MDNFLSWVTQPYQLIIGDYILPIVWGMVIGLLYIKTGNAMLTALVGIFLLTGFVSSNAYLNSNTGNLFFWGIAVAAVAFGSALFYLVKVRVHQPA